VSIRLATLDDIHAMHPVRLAVRENVLSDQWWRREGRYDRGVRLNAQWFADADTESERSGEESWLGFRYPAD